MSVEGIAPELKDAIDDSQLYGALAGALVKQETAAGAEAEKQAKK
jgi:hypothetical protein